MVGLEYDKPYVVVERLSPSYDQYADEIADIAVGTRVEFRPDYHGGGPWAFDQPVAVYCVDEKTGKVLACTRRLSLDLIFNGGYEDDKGAYRVLPPGQAAAVLAGVPVRDVLA